MKKSVFILFLVFLAIVGMETSGLAQDIQKYITMSKDISSSGEFYAIQFDLFGEQLKKVNKVVIDVPKSKKILLRNQLNFNRFLLSSDNMTFDEFKRRFPEGEYSIDFSPRSYGRFRSTMIYNFPNPVITYPPDGTANVPTHLTILWEPLANISDLQLTIRSGAYELSNSLPIDVTSFTVSQDLDHNTQYQVALRATTTDFEGNALVTTQTVTFTTGLE